MSTATYPFGADHDDRDRARLRAELGAHDASASVRSRLGFVRRRLHRRTASSTFVSRR